MEMLLRSEIESKGAGGEPRESQRRLRAIIELVDGELKIYPISGSDTEERAILDGLRFIVSDGPRN